MIEYVHRPSKDEFFSKSSGRSKPIVIRSGMENWAAVSSWSIDSFRLRFGHVIVRAAYSNDGIFRGDPEKGFKDSIEPIQLNRFLDIITGRLHSTRKYYLQQLPLVGELLELHNDIEVPEYIEPRSLKAINLWFGPGGNVSPLHFDHANNFLCQVSGTKRLVLFPPQQTDLVYPFPNTSRIPHMAQVDIERPDYDKFPRFAHATPLEAIVHSGDMIFLPTGWWHQVYSMSTSMSVNFWWL
jgi:hypothetical protein